MNKGKKIIATFLIALVAAFVYDRVKTAKGTGAQ